MRKHLVITGGAGFIGHHTIEHVLKNTDWDITTIDRLTYAGNLNRLSDLDCWAREGGRVKFVYHDFRSPLLVPRIAPSTGRINYFIHMGAESHVDRAISEPVLFAESNVVGTVNMLNLAKELAVEKFIYVSTDEVYGASINGHLHKEGEPHRPGNPYSASKSGGEAFAYSFWNTYGLPVIITNTMNNFGERQDVEKFVPKMMRGMLKSKPVIIHVKKNVDGKVVDVSSRCWLHARNHADALLYLLNKGAAGERYNIAGERYNVEVLVKRIASYMGVEPTIRYVEFHKYRPGHDMHYGLDSTKMKEFGWHPPLTFEDSLRNTVRWYLLNKEWLAL